MTSSGNPDCQCLTSRNHKCLAIFPAPPLHLLLILLCLPPLLIVRMMLNGYAVKGEQIWLHFWCQRQSPYRLFLQKPSLFANGHTGTFLSYQLQHKRNGKPHVDASLILLQFSSWVMLFSSSLLFMPHLLSRGPFLMLTITIFLSWDPLHSPYMLSNPYTIPSIIARQGILFAYLFLVMDNYSSS